MTERDYIGNALQLYGVEEYRLQGGKGDGMRFLRVRNGKGIDLSVSVDRCADISDLFFDGVRLNYMSPRGNVAPAYYHLGRDGMGFLDSFNCGLITTCGFDNIGVPNEDDGELHGLHGALPNTPASCASYEVTEKAIVIRAIIPDERIFGRKLVLHRTITVSLEENTLTIEDTVQNCGDHDEPVMYLYHINYGYPLLSEKMKLEISSCKVTPRDDHAADDLDTWNKMLTPTPQFQEQCYYHEFDQDEAVVTLTNEEIGKKVRMTFPTDVFPFMTQWKMMGIRDYVLGCEPCTNTLEGRHEVGKAGALQSLKPGEKKQFSVKFRLDRI